MNQVDVLQLERDLKFIFRPVNPEKEFIQKLKKRLVTPPSIVMERRSSNGITILLILLVSLLGGVFLVWMLKRL